MVHPHSASSCYCSDTQIFTDTPKQQATVFTTAYEYGVSLSHNTCSSTRKRLSNITLGLCQLWGFPLNTAFFKATHEQFCSTNAIHFSLYQCIQFIFLGTKPKPFSIVLIDHKELLLRLCLQLRERCLLIFFLKFNFRDRRG